MCGCGSSATSGPTATVYVATPNGGVPVEFTDRVTAEAYVAALGGGVVQPKQPATVSN